MSNFFDALSGGDPVVSMLQMPAPQEFPRRKRRLPTGEVIDVPEVAGTPSDALPSPVDPMTEVEPGLLRSLGDAALSGLSVVGNFLDLPASMLRDVATLDNPFDQLLTPFSAENRNTGRDVLTKWGVTEPNDPDKWEAADFAGFGIDLVSGLPQAGLNLGGAALGRGGQVAKAAGLLDDVGRVAPAGVGPMQSRMTTTLDDLLKPRPGEADNASRLAAANDAAQAMGVDLSAVMSEPLGGLVGVGLPFQEPSRILGTGPKAQTFAAWLDDAAAKLKQTAPVRATRALFDPSVGGKVDTWGQKVAEQAHQLKPEAKRAAQTLAADMRERLDEVHRAFDEHFGDALRGAGSGAGPYPAGAVVHALDRQNYGRVIGPGTKGAKVEFISPETGAAAIVDLPFDQLAAVSGSIADDVARRATSRVFDRVVRFTAERGGDAGEALSRIVGQGADQAPAELLDSLRAVGDDMQAANKAVHEAIIAKGGSTQFLDESDLVEGAFEHLPRYVDKAQAESIQRAGGKTLPRKHGSMYAREQPIERIPTDVVNELLTNPATRGPDAADYLTGSFGKFLDPKFGIDEPAAHAEELAGWLAGRPLKELFTRSPADDFLRYQLGAQSVSRTLDAVHATIARTMGADGVPLPAAFKQAGMRPNESLAHLAAVTGRSFDDLARQRIPADVLGGVTGVLQPGAKSEWGRAITDAVDKFHRTFRNWVTLPFPAFAARNFTSGQVVNLSTGLVNNPADLRLYGQAFRDTAKQLKEGVPADYFRELRINGVLPSFGFLETSVSQGFDTAGPANPFRFRDTAREVAEAVADRPLAVDRVPGVPQARRAAGTVISTGAKASENVEYMNRVAMFEYLKRKGWSPAAAAEKVSELHFDYTDLAPFERGVMKRLVPFYTFSRKALPLTLGTLYAKPGGIMAQTIRATTGMSGGDASTPDYIAGTTSIPLGDTADGAKRYLTGFGLMHEDPLSFFGSGALLEAASRMTPLVRGPLEWATGESFFQQGPHGGRDLDKVDPLVGRILANASGRSEPVTFPGSDALEFVLANSPLARVLSTTRTATDPRKGAVSKLANLATGIRVSEVSPGAQDAALRERVQELQRELGGREFTSVGINAERLALLPPETQAKVRELNEATAVLAKRAKQRKAVRELAGTK